MIKVFLGLGSNKVFENCNSPELLNCAFAELKEVLSDAKMSSIYKTPPMYVENQDYFYNAVVSGFVDDCFSPFELLKIINSIEEKFGRNREKEIRNGPRSLDIDIEFFGNQNINSEKLQIPHPRITERAFVLIPMLEILDKSADNLMSENIEKYLASIGSLEKEKICQICLKQ